MAVLRSEDRGDVVLVVPVVPDDGEVVVVVQRVAGRPLVVTVFSRASWNGRERRLEHGAATTRCTRG